jgi:hypothetical protein
MSSPDLIATFSKNKREVVHVTLNEYMGSDLIDLRVHVPKPNAAEGEVIPTAKGLALGISKLPELRAALDLAQAEAERRGLLPIDGGAR